MSELIITTQIWLALMTVVLVCVSGYRRHYKTAAVLGWLVLVQIVAAELFFVMIADTLSFAAVQPSVTIGAFSILGCFAVFGFGIGVICGQR